MADPTGVEEQNAPPRAGEEEQAFAAPAPPDVDPDAVLAADKAEIDDFLALRRAVFSDESLENRLRKAVKKLEKEKGLETDTELRVKYGASLWILRKSEEACEILGSCRTNITGAYFLGRCLLESGQTAEALDILEKTWNRKPNSLACALSVVRAQQKLGMAEASLKVLKDLAKEYKGDDEILYLQGFAQDYLGFHEKAVDLYRKALDANPFNEGALFRLAYKADLFGDEEEAFRLYRRCLEANPPNTHAMINLGLLYEDAAEYQKAIECYESVLKTYPNHARAQAFLQDAVSSLDMHVDEEREKKEDKLAQILRIPVTDFELSVRSRNCLKKMEIQTLGDLITKTEAELLSYKNFGETSLAEIKTILESKNLSLGMDRDSIDTKSKRVEIRKLLDTGAEDVRNRPIADLGLSIRSRKCMDSLNVRTIGDLTEKTESDLLRCKNFGMTSLQDVRQKLASFGVDLAKA